MRKIGIGRREFLGHGAAGAGSLSLASLMGAGCAEVPADSAAELPPGRTLGDSAFQETSWRGAVVQADGGELLVSGRRRAPMRIKIDSTVAVGATMSMLVSVVDPGASIPVHLHRNEDELIFIHTGTGVVTLGEERVRVSPGAVLYGARNVWHGVENTGSDTLTWCAIYSPPGFEQYFREAGVRPGEDQAPPTPERLAVLAAKYGMVFRDS